MSLCTRTASHHVLLPHVVQAVKTSAAAVDEQRRRALADAARLADKLQDARRQVRLAEAATCTGVLRVATLERRLMRARDAGTKAVNVVGELREALVEAGELDQCC